MQRTIEVLNALERDGLFALRDRRRDGRHLLYGAFLSFDLDVFVVLPSTTGGLLTLAPIYGELRARGYAEENECVTIEGVPGSFFPAKAVSTTRWSILSYRQYELSADLPDVVNRGASVAVDQGLVSP